MTKAEVLSIFDLAGDFFTPDQMRGRLQQAQQNLGIDGGTPQRAVGVSQSFPHESKIYRTVEAFQKVIIGDLIF